MVWLTVYLEVLTWCLPIWLLWLGCGFCFLDGCGCLFGRLFGGCDLLVGCGLVLLFVCYFAGGLL